MVSTFKFVGRLWATQITSASFLESNDSSHNAVSRRLSGHNIIDTCGSDKTLYNKSYSSHKSMLCNRKLEHSSSIERIYSKKILCTEQNEFQDKHVQVNHNFKTMTGNYYDDYEH